MINYSHIDVWHDVTSDPSDPYWIISLIDLDEHDYPIFFKKEYDDAIFCAKNLSKKLNLKWSEIL